MKRKKLIRKYCLSILFTTLFLVLSTCFLFLSKHTNMIASFSFFKKMNSLSFVEKSSDLALSFDFPILDEMGTYVPAYEFDIVNSSQEVITYQLSFFTGNDTKKIPQNALHYMIQKNDSDYSNVQTLREDGEIALDSINGESTVHYAIKFWVHSDVDSSILGKTFQGMINLTAVH